MAAHMPACYAVALMVCSSRQPPFTGPMALAAWARCACRCKHPSPACSRLLHLFLVSVETHLELSLRLSGRWPGHYGASRGQHGRSAMGRAGLTIRHVLYQCGGLVSDRRHRRFFRAVHRLGPGTSAVPGDGHHRWIYNVLDLCAENRAAARTRGDAGSSWLRPRRRSCRVSQR